MDFLKRAKELKEETIENRRFFHKNAEYGLDMPKACEYVSKKLSEYGIEPVPCGKGVSAILGKGEPVLLLRADMDALPMSEESGESFSSCTNAAHACGHDCHAAMLLTAAKMLKECESELNGTVKLMFQPAEETFEGSKNMIENGILKNPDVDMALAFHVAPGKLLPGSYMYNSGKVMMSSVDMFRIEIKGKGGHGAYPNLTVDPLRIAVEIYSGFQSLIAREANPERTNVLTIGKLCGGSAANIIPDTAVMEGTLRTDDKAERELLTRRIREIAENTAKTYGGTAEVISLSDVPPLVCNEVVTEKVAGYLKELNLSGIPSMKANASEDFAVIAEKVPSAFVYISAGFEDERGNFSAHNPKVRFNEDALSIGSAGLAHCAVRLLQK